MKKFLFSLIAVVVMAAGSFAQTLPSYKKAPSLGINFFLKDLYTAQKIDATSLSAVLNNSSWTPIKNMAPGLSLNYYQGLSDHVDFVGSLGGSFTAFPFSANSNVKPVTNSKFLMEL